MQQLAQPSDVKKNLREVPAPYRLKAFSHTTSFFSNNMLDQANDCC